MGKKYFVEYNVEYTTPVLIKGIDTVRRSSSSRIIDYHPAYFEKKFRENWWAKSISLINIEIIRWSEIPQDEIEFEVTGDIHDKVFSEIDMYGFAKYYFDMIRFDPTMDIKMILDRWETNVKCQKTK